MKEKKTFINKSGVEQEIRPNMEKRYPYDPDDISQGYRGRHGIREKYNEYGDLLIGNPEEEASHFVEIGEDGIVIRCLVAEQDFIDTGLVGDPANWVKTSYGNHFRKQFAGPGFTYDKENDVFIQPRSAHGGGDPSWTLDEYFNWQPPVPRPKDFHLPPEEGGKNYFWSIEKQTWLDNAVFDISDEYGCEVDDEDL